MGTAHQVTQQWGCNFIKADLPTVRRNPFPRGVTLAGKASKLQNCFLQRQCIHQKVIFLYMTVKTIQNILQTSYWHYCFAWSNVTRKLHLSSVYTNLQCKIQIPQDPNHLPEYRHDQLWRTQEFYINLWRMAANVKQKALIPMFLCEIRQCENFKANIFFRNTMQFARNASDNVDVKQSLFYG